MPEPVPPDLPGLEGGTGPYETQTSVTASLVAARVGSALRSVMTHVAAVMTFLQAELATEAETRAAADAFEASTRAAADTAEANTRATTDTSLQNQVNVRATIESPTFTGFPQAPDPGDGDNSGRLVTTARLKRAEAWLEGIISTSEGGLQSQINTKAAIASPSFTGNPLAPTQPDGNRSTRLATTQFAGNIEDYLQGQINARATINNPSFTGNPLVPTQPDGNRSTRIASTQFVANVQDWLQGQIDDRVTWAAHANKADWGHGHVIGDVHQLQAFLDIKANNDSPSLGGTPTAPHPPGGNYSNRLATTKFVGDVEGWLQGQINDRATWTETTNIWNYTVDLQNQIWERATIHNPSFTGAPLAPTQPDGSRNTRIATTQFAGNIEDWLQGQINAIVDRMNRNGLFA